MVRVRDNESVSDIFRIVQQPFLIKFVEIVISILLQRYFQTELKTLFDIPLCELESELSTKKVVVLLESLLNPV